MAISKTPKVRIVAIEWHDACHIGGWQDPDTPYRTARCFSIGRIVRETKDDITICGSWGGEWGVKPGELVSDSVHTPFSIPRKSILDMRDVTWPPRKPRVPKARASKK